ncbi:hypothetical protein HCH_01377 [Hahella chejuensis KCTC 2396]|uniref:Uncharacterized protein n=1 Tax=Hahella chejuensis (strain KCTC 2396) TaxID=349521 RepID=Q2SM84_HAHCH|nr:hypothetical protein HCH_01377 [Hahella chejuensis KCTC 2396]
MKKYKLLLIIVPMILAALHYSYEWRRQTSLLSELRSYTLSSDELWLCNLDGYEITDECFKASKEKLAQALPIETPKFSPGKGGGYS